MRTKLQNAGTIIRMMRVAVFAIASIILSGCLNNRYAAPLSTFTDKTFQTIGILGDFYSSRNSFEIDIYLQTIAADQNLKVEFTDSQGHPTPLGEPVFSPAGIKARLDAMNLVGAYAGKLYDLSNPDGKAGFQTAAVTLGNSLSSLDTTFKKLQKTPDPTRSEEN